jgi:CPA2 family monovalent cation:H+ antiporter-2
MHLPLLQDVVIILGLSVIVVYLFQRLKLPAILGLLITGMIAGPNGLVLVHAVHEVEMMAEVGVILLLFIIGLEFSLKTLASLKKAVLLGGFLQVGLSIGAVMGLALMVGFKWQQALFLGFLVSLSSTAIVLKQLQQRGEHNAPQGRLALAILIFQDIIVVPMMLLTPILSGQDTGDSIWWLLLKAVGVVTVVLYGASYLIPRALHAVAQTRNRELFILTVVVICFAVAWGTNAAGLSLALGAFLAGLIISESEYSYQATGIVLPFREVFSSFFFVSIGMLLDLRFFAEHVAVILALALLVMLLKLFIVVIAVVVLGYPRRTSLLTAMALFQVGEFAFILAALGLQYGLLDEGLQQYFLATSIITMAITPFVIDNADRISGWWMKKAPRPDRALARQDTPDTEDLKDHVIIIGYGLNGRNIARAASRANIPHIVLELNPQNVQQARADGVHVYFGDAANEVVLEHLKVYQARVAVVTINDPVAARQIVRHIRSICNTVHIMVRTHYVTDMDELYRLGANEVIPEEFETSIELFTRLLNQYLVPQDEITTFVNHIRADSIQRMRPEESWASAPTTGLEIPDFNLTCFKVQGADRDLLNQSLQQADLRGRFGLTVAAIQRDSVYLTDLGPDTSIQANDRVFVMGPSEAVARFGESRAAVRK